MTNNTNSIIINNSPIINLLFKDIKKYKLLSKEEEYVLIEKAKNGDKKAKDQLICSNILYAISVAKRYNTMNYPLEDLISEAMLGLLLAFDQFDNTKNVKFITYAVNYIRARLSKVQLKIIDRPYAYVIHRKRINETRMRLEQIYNTDIPLEMLADELEIKDTFLLNIQCDMFSLSDLDNNLNIQTTLNEKTMTSPFFEPTIMELYENLPEQERYIVGCRLGLDGPSKSIKTLAEELNMSVEEVDTHYANGIKRIKNDYL